MELPGELEVEEARNWPSDETANSQLARTAPGGQPYWFNPLTNISTYTRPGPPPPPAGFPVAGLPPPPPGFPIAGVPPPPAGFPAAHSAAPAQLPPLHFTAPGAAPVEKKEKKEKPKEKLPIEGTDWIRVTTNKGNVFYNNKETKESLWTVPEDIKKQIEALEKREKEEREAKEKAEREEREKEEQEAAAAAAANARKRKADDDAEASVRAALQKESEQQKGALDLEIEGADGASALPEKAASPTAVEEQPKKKKQKKRVVTSLEELEKGDMEGVEPAKAEKEGGEEEDDEEAWQRQMAEQMAQEAEGGAAPAKEEIVVMDAAAARGPQLVVDQVEAAALYRVRKSLPLLRVVVLTFDSFSGIAEREGHQPDGSFRD